MSEKIVIIPFNFNEIKRIANQYDCIFYESIISGLIRYYLDGEDDILIQVIDSLIPTGEGGYGKLDDDNFDYEFLTLLMSLETLIVPAVNTPTFKQCWKDYVITEIIPIGNDTMIHFEVPGSPTNLNDVELKQINITNEIETENKISQWLGI